MSTNSIFYTVSIYDNFTDTTTTYKILVPATVSRAQVFKTFDMAKKYCKTFCPMINCTFHVASYHRIDSEELWKIYETDYKQYIKLGSEAFDEYFNQVYNRSSHHPNTVFEYYIGKCVGWSISELISDYIIMCK